MTFANSFYPVTDEAGKDPIPPQGYTHTGVTLSLGRVGLPVTLSFFPGVGLND